MSGQAGAGGGYRTEKPAPLIQSKRIYLLHWYRARGYRGYRAKKTCSIDTEQKRKIGKDREAFLFYSLYRQIVK